jgi:hypothetical protein
VPLCCELIWEMRRSTSSLSRWSRPRPAAKDKPARVLADSKARALAVHIAQEARLPIDGGDAVDEAIAQFQVMGPEEVGHALGAAQAGQNRSHLAATIADGLGVIRQQSTNRRALPGLGSAHEFLQQPPVRFRGYGKARPIPAHPLSRAVHCLPHRRFALLQHGGDLVVLIVEHLSLRKAARSSGASRSNMWRKAMDGRWPAAAVSW